MVLEICYIAHTLLPCVRHLKRMSKTTKRKFVVKEVCNEFYLPEDDQSIVKVIASPGNNLHEVEDSQTNHFLVSMPTKFRRNVWIKRGDFIVIKPITEGNKVKGEIVRILYSDQIKYIKQNNLWPKEFESELLSKEDGAGFIPKDMLPPSESESDKDEEFDEHHDDDSDNSN